jgi:hypothetical protein
VQVLLAAAGGQPEQHRVAGSAVAAQPPVGLQFRDEAPERLGAVVHLQEPAHGGGGVMPDAVAVGSDPAAERGRGALLGPPPVQAGAGMRAGVGKQFDEELVDADQVVQVGPGEDGVLAFLQRDAAGWPLTAGQRDVAGGQRARHPVRRAARAGAGAEDAVDEAEPAQRVQPVRAGGVGGEQSGGDLCGGQRGVVVEQGGQDVVAGGQPGGDLQQGGGGPARVAPAWWRGGGSPWHGDQAIAVTSDRTHAAAAACAGRNGHE